MARYELGAVYEIKSDNGRVYYVRLLDNDSYGVFAPFNGELSESILLNTPYHLYFSCNTFAVKREIWKKVLSPSKSDETKYWKAPDLANYGNFNPELFISQHRIYHLGNTFECKKEKFIELLKSGMIENIFNRYEIIPAFLDRYYDDWPNSYIMDKQILNIGTQEHIREKLEILKEIGFDTTIV